MGRMTFVCHFEDGQEPEITADMHFMSGKVITYSDTDLTEVLTRKGRVLYRYQLGFLVAKVLFLLVGLVAVIPMFLKALSELS